MNQILVTKKLYITPELKRKKKIYKFDFLLSIFLVCILISLCIYAEYDRNKSEETSQEIMSEFNTDAQEDTTVAKNNILIVVLDDSEQIMVQLTMNLIIRHKNKLKMAQIRKMFKKQMMDIDILQ